MASTTDLGLPDKSHLPNCASCRKQSDAFQKVTETVLCGRCYDKWLASPERYAAGKDENNKRIEVARFAARMRSTTFKACWEVEPLRRDGGPVLGE